MKQSIVLIVLDGWGIGKEDSSNPIYMARPKTIEYIESNYMGGALQASGSSVGLPWEVEGNSEVGHLTLGAGKVLYQYAPRISQSIDDGSFFKNQEILGAFEHAKKNNSCVHLVGLLSKGSVHSHINHLRALLSLAETLETPFSLHLFADGVDSSQKSFLDTLKELNIGEKGVLSSVCGRYYAMDRDEHFDRTATAYNLIVGKKGASSPLEEVIGKLYGKNLSDEFLEPTFLTTGKAVSENDALIFFNFREDSMRQIIAPFVDPHFSKFPYALPKNLYVASLTEYFNSPLLHVAFHKEVVENPLGKVLSENGKVQLRVGESEKYAHITYFFNGLRDAPFPQEFRVLIPSRNIPQHDKEPKMMAGAIVDRVVSALEEGVFDFILVNFANADVIAHTGNFDATLQAVLTIDECLAKLTVTAENGNHILLITADHGNAETLIDLSTGQAETKHNANAVPFYVVGNSFKKTAPSRSRLVPIGLLSDVAPTILDLFKISKPEDMTGQSLLDQLT